MVISCTEHLLIRVGERNPELQRTSPTFPDALPLYPSGASASLLHRPSPDLPIGRSSENPVTFLVSIFGSLGLSPNLFYSASYANFGWSPRGTARLRLAAARSSRTCGEAPHSALVTGHLAWFLGTSLGCGGAYSRGSSLCFLCRLSPRPVIFDGSALRAFDTTTSKSSVHI